MKVLILNTTCGNGSTGVIAVEIANLLKQRGHDVFIAYGQGTSNYENSFKIGTSIDTKIHALWHTRVLGLEGYGSKSVTKQFIRRIKKINPDIVYIENLHSNFLNYKSFFKYLADKKIPVVWSFYDCWPFTGKCVHFTEAKCYKWIDGCHDCPQLHTSGAATFLFDRTQKLYLEKQQLFNSLHSLDIIVCSNWLKGVVEKSFLRDHPIHMIYNWIDTEKFSENKDNTVYERYGLDKTKQIILSVSAGWGLNSRLDDAIRLANILPERFQLVIVGSMQKKTVVPTNLKHINYVDGVRELSKLYSVALAYANFSVEDTFGKVMAEAELCGTPAIVFDATACPEVVGDAGFVVKPHDVNAMLEKILEIEKNGRAFYSAKAIDYVRNNFDYKSNAGKYIEVFESIVKH